ncbi:MAG: MopE-related protein [Polyangiaceae bacterium]
MTKFSRLLLSVGALGAASFAMLRTAEAQCTSPNPADWPAPAKPYFLLMVDTSGSMTDPVGSNTTCAVGANSYGSDRRAHARCAVRNAILAYSGQVNFGLAHFATNMTGCSNSANGLCNFGSCTYQAVTGTSTGNCTSLGVNGGGCGPEPSPDANSSTRAGAYFRVGVPQDIGSPANNVAALLDYVDGSCSNSHEIFAAGCTPLNGMLRDAFRYYSNQWVPPTPIPGGSTLTSPLTSAAAGERACRSVNVILITDGDETCDTQANAVTAAAALYNGFTKDGITWHVKTYVINFAGGSQANTDDIADAGDDGNSANNSAVSYFANDETQLSLALSDIISNSIAPEVCDNADNNCNGCVDEGYTHYCDVGQTCCAWVTPAQRQTCLTNYQNSLNTQPPNGDLTLLPCTTAAQQTDSANWLCYNPGDQCDNTDNNCSAGVDENATKCGNPQHCPTSETCNGQDDDCDGIVDDGVCSGCVPSPEVCDGCDNDCDGVADDGIAPIPCGFSPPANCAGTITCKPANAAPVGGCVAGGGFNTCSSNPQTETCDTVDNDCDGIADDGVAPTACVPAGTPGGLNYGANSQCKMGSQACGSTTCVGFVGPSAEICDGIDNDCDGVVDDSPFGVGQQCGTNTAPCSPGVTACVNGALVCQGGTQPKPEVCDGIDNDCDGTADDAPLSDAPGPGANGCWPAGGGNCCSFPAAPIPGAPPPLQWCPPAGATCTGTGSLTSPCNKGSLVCGGVQGWLCQGGTLPSGEVCDGVDNNCNGASDEGTFPGEGQACGNSTPPCQAGVIDCQNGILDCVGDIPPTSEVCNGIDDNCDGTIDNGIAVGGSCVMPYDTNAFPGDRSAAPCQPGTYECDGNGGLICVGGVGPSAEDCDGVDNDCDGVVDELGAAPDGIDDTVGTFGDACGSSVGECSPGTMICLNGQFVCSGGKPSTTESCDCKDNDCDGTNDNQNPNNIPPLCGSGADCVSANGSCQCAEPCGTGEFPCPAGQLCTEVTSSQTGQVLGNYCLVDLCNKCDTKTVTDASGDVVCAPAGSEAAGCAEVGVCQCKGQDGCRAPCYGVTCDTPLVCTDIGPQAGTCVADNCFNLGCSNCDDMCTDLGSCAPNPCQPDTCPTADCPTCTVCRPSGDGLTSTCVASCADVNCDPGTECKDGVCVPTCSPACAADQYCDTTQDPPACADSNCDNANCGVGCCNPATGSCEACPCEGVVCPTDQACVDGECVGDTSMGGMGGGGVGGAGVGGGGNGQGADHQGGSTGPGPDDKGVWGLATGGGGCACEIGPKNDAKGALGIVGLLGLAALRWSRKRRSSAKKEVA